MLYPHKNVGTTVRHAKEGLIVVTFMARRHRHSFFFFYHRCRLLYQKCL